MNVRKRYSYDITNCNITITVKTTYRIGDVITIVDRGGIYPTYTEAIDYFNLKYRLSNMFDLPEKKILNKLKWVIVNIVIHESHQNDIILHIHNKKYGDFIISSKYVKKHKIPKHISNRLRIYYNEKKFHLTQLNGK